MKLKTNNAAKNPTNAKKNKSPKKQTKGVEVRKEKSKEVVKPKVLKKEGEKTPHVVVPQSPQKILQQELWSKAIVNVSNMSNLSNEENSIVKLLADYKTKSSIPQKSTKLKNFITKGFSKFKDTSDEVLNGVHTKILNEYKAIGGNDETIVGSKKTDTKTKKVNAKKPSAVEEMAVDEEDDDDDDDDNDEDDDTEGIEFGNSGDDDDDDDDDNDDDDDDESEEDKPKPKGNKVNAKNGKSQPNKGKNGSKFKGGKVQKNKKFGKKK